MKYPGSIRNESALDYYLSDFFRLGLYQSGDPPAEWDSGTTFALVNATRNIGQVPVPRNIELVTAAGQTVLSVMQTGVLFRSHPVKLGVCNEAEESFMETVAQPTDEYTPPILVTDTTDKESKKNILALIKPFGVPTAYAFSTDVKKGLVAQTITAPERPIDPSTLAPDCAAYVATVSDLGKFFPLRYAISLIPEADRVGVHRHRGTFLDFNESNLLAGAYNMLRNPKEIRTLAPKEIRIAQRETTELLARRYS